MLNPSPEPLLRIITFLISLLTSTVCEELQHTDVKEDRQRVEAFEMWCFRRLLRVSRTLSVIGIENSKRTISELINFRLDIPPQKLHKLAHTDTHKTH